MIWRLRGGIWFYQGSKIVKSIESEMIYFNENSNLKNFNEKGIQGISEIISVELKIMHTVFFVINFTENNEIFVTRHSN